MNWLLEKLLKRAEEAAADNSMRITLLQVRIAMWARWADRAQGKMDDGVRDKRSARYMRKWRRKRKNRVERIHELGGRVRMLQRERDGDRS